VEFYYSPNGEIPAAAFYENCSEGEKRRFFHIVEHLTDHPRGKPLPKTMFHEEDATNKIYAIKAQACRYLGFFAPGGKFIVCETYYKQTQALGRREKRFVEKTAETKKEYTERVQRGEYYESE
jgi:Phage derived protein Gp49-like (DUF891)